MKHQRAVHGAHLEQKRVPLSQKRLKTTHKYQAAKLIQIHGMPLTERSFLYKIHIVTCGGRLESPHPPPYKTTGKGKWHKCRHAPRQKDTEGLIHKKCQDGLGLRGMAEPQAERKKRACRDDRHARYPMGIKKQVVTFSH